MLKASIMAKILEKVMNPVLPNGKQQKGEGINKTKSREGDM